MRTKHTCQQSPDALMTGKLIPGCPRCDEWIARRNRKNTARRERDQAMRDLGLVKVKGSLGGTYWE